MTLFGIFVGGKASRMGGEAKGLLLAPDSGEPLVVRLVRLAEELGCEPVLIGSDPRYQAALPGLRAIADAPAGVGPLGGLAGLLAAAGREPALALACDLPFVSRSLLQRLLDETPTAGVVAPRAANGLWEPLCARYQAGRVAPRLQQALGAGVRSFQALFSQLEVVELTLDATARTQLVDWDSPDDLARMP